MGGFRRHAETYVSPSGVSMGSTPHDLPAPADTAGVCRGHPSIPLCSDAFGVVDGVHGRATWSSSKRPFSMRNPRPGGSSARLRAGRLALKTESPSLPSGCRARPERDVLSRACRPKLLLKKAASPSATTSWSLSTHALVRVVRAFSAPDGARSSMRSTKTATGLVTRPSSISAASRFASADVASPPDGGLGPDAEVEQLRRAPRRHEVERRAGAEPEEAGRGRRRPRSCVPSRTGR